MYHIPGGQIASADYAADRQSSAPSTLEYAKLF